MTVVLLSCRVDISILILYCSKLFKMVKIKVKKECLWKHLENRRLGLIESLHMQHCNLRGCLRAPPPPPPHAPPSPSPPGAGLSGIRISKYLGWAQ